MSTLPRSLTDSLFMAAFLICTGGLKALYVAWVVDESDAMFRNQPTQRTRYFILSLSTLINFGSVIFILYTNGWSQFTAGIGDYWDVPPIGWLIGLAVWFGLFSPLLTLLTARHIYLYPSPMAKRVRGGWIATRDTRAGLQQMPIYKVEKFRTAGGQLLKRYVPTGRFA